MKSSLKIFTSTHWLLCLLIFSISLPTRANSACSSYLGDVVINEFYDGQGSGVAFVETKLLHFSLPLFFGGWSIRVCHRQGNRNECDDLNFAGGEWVDYIFGNPYFMFTPSNQSMDMNGMDITVRDYRNNVIDYLSINGYEHQKNDCAAVADSSLILGSGVKGAQRLPDGTGNWYPFEKSGATNETTPNRSNEGALSQIHHYRIYHPADALTCQAASVTVAACADTECINRYDNQSTVGLSANSPDAVWIGGNERTFTGESSSILFRNNKQVRVSLGIASASPAAGNPLRCFKGGVASDCTIDFHDSGFVFDVSPLTSCQNSAAVTIQAVRKDDDTQACVGDGSFANQVDKPVNFSTSYLDPLNSLTALWINGQTLPLNGTAATVLLDFDGEAKSSLALNYADAGKLRINATYVGSGDEAGLIMAGSSAEFVVTPHHLRVRATTDTGGTTPLNNATPNGEPHWPAGEDFQVEVAGVCADGTVTPNFAAATTLTAIAADPGLVVPDPFSGRPFDADAYSGGRAIGSVSYGEVGTVTLQAVAADYLGSGTEVTGISDPLGRFTPHHFAVSFNDPRFASGCGAGGFTYLGQPFDFAVAPVLTVTAQNQQNGTTRNYTGDWWKIRRDTLNGRLYSAAEGTLDPSGLPEEDPTISDLGGGVGLLTFAAGDGLLFERSAPSAPFEAEISLEINMVDEDGIVCADNPVRFGAATPGTGIAFDEGKSMRWGRLTFKNAYGSELVPLNMPLRTEYFSGTAFVLNSDDGCTSTPLSSITLVNTTGTVTADQAIAVGSGSTRASLSDPVVSGDAGFGFSAPRAEGYVDVTAGLALLPWLPYDWDGDGTHDNDPSARATFGIYKSRPSLIYRRESFR